MTAGAAGSSRTAAAVPPAGVLTVRLLGEQTVTGGPVGAQPRASRTIELLAHLVLHTGELLPRQRLAAVFWPDSSGQQALTNLRRELHQLRALLGREPALRIEANGLGWADASSAWVDLRVFCRAADAAQAAGADAAAALAHAETAITVYRGELLPAAYQDWVLEGRAELAERCAALCALVARLRADRGEFVLAVAAARQRIRLQPLEESGYRTLMELQLELGDRAAAVSVYHRCASVLERELGVDPDAATRAALQRVLSSDTAPAPEPESHRPARAVLVGREQELGRLQSCWQAARAGRAGVVLVRGGAGVGKTALVDALAGAARRSGAVVAGSRCFGTSGRLALAPVADWLRAPPLRAPGAALEPVWREQVQRLVPDAPAAAGSTSSSRAMVDAWQRHRFYEGLARAVLAPARATLLVLDDVQWCDQETLTFLAFLLGLEPGAALLVATTLRTDDDVPSPAVEDWVVRLRAGGLLTELAVEPLAAEQTATLAAAVTGQPLSGPGRDLLQVATGGFPLHVVEALRAAQRTGGQPQPGDLTEVLRSRLEQTGRSAREVAGLAAAVGRDFTLDLLVEASDLPEDTVVRAVDELWARRILREQGEGYDFAHDLLRSAAYAQVSPPRRWLLHRRLAQSLELLHGEDLDLVSAQLAEQYARGGRASRALPYYRRAAEVAAARFAHAESVRLNRQALRIVRQGPTGREGQRQELSILEAMAAPLNARHGYSSPQLESVLERSIELAEGLGRTDALVGSLVGLWGSQFVQGRIAQAHRTACRALELVPSAPEYAGAAHFAVAGTAVSLGSPAEALSHFEAAAEHTRGATLSVGTRPDVHGRAWSAHAYWLLGEPGQALATAGAAVALARALNHPYSVAVALAYAGVTQQIAGHGEELLATVVELRQLCERHGFGYYPQWGLVLQGWRLGGEPGLALIQQGISALRSAGSFARMPYWLCLQADVLVRLDRRPAARAVLDSAAAMARARSDLWWLPEVQRRRALLDRPQEACGPLTAAADLAREQGSTALLARIEADLADPAGRTLRERRSS